MKNMKIIIRQKISNHHINNDVERYVTIRRIADNADVDEIANAGYATDPNYAASLKSIIKRIQQYV